MAKRKRNARKLRDEARKRKYDRKRRERRHEEYWEAMFQDYLRMLEREVGGHVGRKAARRKFQKFRELGLY